MEHPDGIIVDVEDQRGLLTLDPDARFEAREAIITKIQHRLLEWYIQKCAIQWDTQQGVEQTNAWTWKNFRIPPSVQIDEFLTLRVADRPCESGLYQAHARVDLPATTSFFTHLGVTKQEEPYTISFQISCRLRRTCSPEE